MKLILTYQEALDVAIRSLRCNLADDECDTAFLESVADILDTCQCKSDFTDGTGYCQECQRKAR